jgi:cytochrome c2
MLKIIAALVACSAFAVPVAAQDNAADIQMGERLVKSRCTFCHAQKSLPELVAKCMGGHGEEYLDKFLTTHHAPDEDARADIIAYLTCNTME